MLLVEIAVALSLYLQKQVGRPAIPGLGVLFVNLIFADDAEVVPPGLSEGAQKKRVRFGTRFCLDC